MINNTNPGKVHRGRVIIEAELTEGGALMPKTVITLDGNLVCQTLGLAVAVEALKDLNIQQKAVRDGDYFDGLFAECRTEAREERAYMISTRLDKEGNPIGAAQD